MIYDSNTRLKITDLNGRTILVNEFLKSRLILIIFLCSIATLSLSGQTERKYIRQGNKDYNKGQFNESELLYRKAFDANKSSSDAVFNIGDALYKQQKYDEASIKFNENFTSVSGIKEKANSMYNLGNSLLKSQKVEESIAAYKNSLKLDPTNNNAKYNLAYAQDLLKQQQQQQQQQNQDQKKDQQNNNQDQNNDQNQQSKNQEEQQQQQQQQEQQQQSISKEDAERLLSALANDESKVQEKVKKDQAEKGTIRTIKNW
jgi:Ca-activated chloride channel family protein